MLLMLANMCRHTHNSGCNTFAILTNFATHAPTKHTNCLNMCTTHATYHTCLRACATQCQHTIYSPLPYSIHTYCYLCSSRSMQLTRNTSESLDLNIIAQPKHYGTRFFGSSCNTKMTTTLFTCKTRNNQRMSFNPNTRHQRYDGWSFDSY